MGAEESSITVPDNDEDGYPFLGGQVKIRANNLESTGEYDVDLFADEAAAVTACGGDLPSGLSYTTLLDLTCPPLPATPNNFDVWVSGASNYKWFHCSDAAGDWGEELTVAGDWVHLDSCSGLVGGRAGGGKQVSAPAFDALGLAVFFALAAVAAILVLAKKK